MLVKSPNLNWDVSIPAIAKCLRQDRLSCVQIVTYDGKQVAQMLDLTYSAPCELNKKESSNSTNKNCKINYQIDGQRKYVKLNWKTRSAYKILTV